MKLPEVNDKSIHTMRKMIENINSVNAMYSTWCLEDDDIDVRSAELEVLMMRGEQACCLGIKNSSLALFIPVHSRFGVADQR